MTLPWKSPETATPEARHQRDDRPAAQGQAVEAAVLRASAPGELPERDATTKAAPVR